MKDHDVNFNNKTILLEGEWFNIKELGEKIKYNINKGNYKIKHLSVALERLQEILESAKDIKVSVLSETYDELEKISTKYGKNIEIIVRDAIDQYINFLNETPNKNNNSSMNKEEESIDIEVTDVPKQTKKEKPEVIKIDKSSRNKPSIIENKVINSDKEIKKQPSIIVNKEDDDDWFNQ